MVSLESYIKMVFYLLISGIIGWIAGFIMGRIFGSANATELLREGDNKVRMKEQEVSALRADLVAVNNNISTTQTELATLSATIKTRDGWINEMEAKQKELHEDLEARITELDQLKADTDKEKDDLNTQLAQARTAAAKALETFKLAMAAQAQESEGQRTVLETAKDEAQETLNRITVQVKEREAEIAQLKVRLTELEMMAREVKEAPAKVSTASALPPSPKERDDLKQVFGISPEVESLLNQQGIYWFQQIAKWSQDDAKLYDSLFVASRGHVEHDGVVASAKEAHLKKYGEQL